MLRRNVTRFYNATRKVTSDARTTTLLNHISNNINHSIIDTSKKIKPPLRTATERL
jgi:hypothetical protein